MPTLDNVRTKSSEIAWQSPDKQRTIHKILLDYQGQDFEARTYSDAIAAVGWSGTVETYEVPGKGDFPAQTFVKQPQKEGGYRGGGGGGGRPQRDSDPFTMYLSYAKDVAVALLETTGGLDGKKLTDALSLVAEGGHFLYDNRPGATPTALGSRPSETRDISDIFGEAGPPPPVDQSELPWQPKP